MRADSADVWWWMLPHLVWSGWSSLEPSSLERRLQKSHWTLSRLKWERAATVATGLHPGEAGREDLVIVCSAGRHAVTDTLYSCC